MTLADVLPMARQLAPAEKLRLIRILVDELDSSDETAPTFEAEHAYPVHTPLSQYGVAEGLFAAFPDVHLPGR